MSTQKSVTITFSADIDLQDRDGYWAAYIDPLGITIYGTTENDAKTRAHRAVRAAIKSLNDHAGTDVVEKYLAGRGVQYRSVESLLTTSPVRHAEKITMSLQPAGVP